MSLFTGRRGVQIWWGITTSYLTLMGKVIKSYPTLLGEGTQNPFYGVCSRSISLSHIFNFVFLGVTIYLWRRVTDNRVIKTLTIVCVWWAKTHHPHVAVYKNIPPSDVGCWKRHRQFYHRVFSLCMYGKYLLIRGKSWDIWSGWSTSTEQEIWIVQYVLFVKIMKFQLMAYEVGDKMTQHLYGGVIKTCFHGMGGLQKQVHVVVVGGGAHNIHFMESLWSMFQEYISISHMQFCLWYLLPHVICNMINIEHNSLKSINTINIIPNSYNLCCIEVDTTVLRYKDGGDSFIDCCSIHVDDCAHWCHETCDAMVDANIS